MTVRKKITAKYTVVAAATYKVGEDVVVPAHGVGKITKVEEGKIVVKITDSSATLIVLPGREAEMLRKLISETEAKSIFNSIKAKDSSPTTWNRQFRDLMDKLRTGSAKDHAEVLMELAGIKSHKDFSYGELKMFDKSMSLVSEELGLVLKKSAADVESAINAKLFPKEERSHLKVVK